MASNGIPGRKIGHGEGYGSDPVPSFSIRGKTVEGGDDFYVQKLNRTNDEFDYERETITPGLCILGEDDD